MFELYLVVFILCFISFVINLISFCFAIRNLRTIKKINKSQKITFKGENKEKK